MLRNKRTTTCPKCDAGFSIAENHKFQVESKYAPFWFFDAMNQFENFSQVKCPECGHEYEAKEARLFSVFKSPYLVIAIGILIVLIAILINLRLLGKL
jgi:uncharacterized Zn-finger protein